MKTLFTIFALILITSCASKNLQHDCRFGDDLNEYRQCLRDAQINRLNEKGRYETSN